MLKDILWTFFISMVPLIELRGAIPVGCGLGLSWWQNYLVSVIGNMLPIPFILLLVESVLNFMKRHNIFPRLVAWLEEKAQKGVQRVGKRGEIAS